MTLALAAAGLIAALGATVAVVLLLALTINVICRVPYAGTPPAQIERIFEAIALAPGQRFVDLGCGDGRVVFGAARRGAIAVGFELQPLTFLRAKLVQRLRYPRAGIRYGDFRQVKLADADVVFCFLVAAVMPRVAAWIKQHLRPGATVISYGFPLPGWQANMVLEPLKPNGSKIFLYQKIGTPSRNGKNE